MAKKTLSQQLTEYLKPQTYDYDIEDSERVNPDDELAESSDEESKKEHYVEVGKSKLRKEEVKLDGKYKGKPVSRKDLLGDVSDEDSGDEIGTVEAEESPGQSDQESENEGSSSGVDLSAESESGESGSESESEHEVDDEAAAMKREKIKAIMEKESDKATKTMQDTMQLDALKGFHILQQRSAYDAIVNGRIKFQKALSTTNQLPLDKEAVEKFSTEKTEKYISKAEKSIFALLDTILELRYALFKKSKIFKPDREYTKKRSLEEYLEECESLDSTLNTYRGVVLTKWSQKVQAASGLAVLNAAKFNSINQTAAVQVENNLANMERLARRTRLNRRNVVPLGYVVPENEEKGFKDPALEENSKIFDDEDFYRLLLRDLIDNKVNSSVSVSENTITLTKAKKFKKNVDTKASKGRKLNYKPQEPLINYMAASSDKNRWDDYQIDEFFTGLFGQKVDMDEEEKEAEENDEEAIAIANDNLRLFA